MSDFPRLDSTGAGPINTLGKGEWIGEYEILHRIRHGGMATLFLGRKHGVAGFSRNAAIKVIHPHLSINEEFVRMFADEARICSQISHPNVIHVEAFGQEQGLHYMVMEYLESCSLKELLKVYRREKRELDPELAAHIIMQVAGGLHAAHESRGMDGQPLGIIHRDVSPSNILLSTDGHVKIIDFGIAKSRGRLAETQGGQALKGKLKYMAPEQAETGVELTRRADIFSLGVVFWEMLVGRPLFKNGSELALLKRLTEPDVPIPSSINPKVPSELDGIVMSMLAQDPEERPETAWDVRRQIVAALPAALTRQSDEIGKISADIVGERDVTEASVRSSAPFGFGTGSASGLSESVSRPVASSYEEVVVERSVEKEKSMWQNPFFQALVVGSVIALSVLLGLSLRGRGAAKAAGPVATSVGEAQPQTDSPSSTNVAVSGTSSGTSSGANSGTSQAPTPGTTPSPQAGSATLAGATDDTPGTLSVRTDRSAKIYINDERVGKGTVEKLELKPGAYLLEIRMSGRRDFRRAVVIEPGGSAIVDAPLATISKRRTRTASNKSSPPKKATPTPTPKPTKPTKTTARETSSSSEPKKPSKPDCTAPFYFKDGKKIFKPACL